jgi:hypothetical protein
MNENAERVREKFTAHRNQSWLVGGTVAKGVLAETIRHHLVNTLPADEKNEWYELHAAKCIPRKR